MSMSATAKILAAHAGLAEVKAGDIVVADVDLAMANDITAPVAIAEIAKMHGQIVDKNAVCLVLDHFVPNKDIKSAEQCKCVRRFANENGIDNFFDVGETGIEHALLPEKGFVKPSSLILGADSHTCTYGALGAFSTGVGSTDFAVAAVTKKCWLRVPEAYKIEIVGTPKKYVGGKDVILHLIGLLGVDGATYKALEFCGDGLKNLSVDDRFTIANMAVECGAKCAFFPVDESTRAYLKEAGVSDYSVTAPDDDYAYERTITVNLDELKPTVAFPHLPDNTRTFDEDFNIEIDQVVIGSCTNGRLSDMKIASDILKGKKVAKGVRVIIIPATQKIYAECLDLGYIKTFIEAGAVVSTPTCGPCLGGYMGILAEGERAVATTNRNFVGRMGHAKSEVYLASPAVAAASALTGRLTDPNAL